MRLIKPLMLVGLAGILTACPSLLQDPPPSSPPGTVAPRGQSLVGKVDWGEVSPGYRDQATMTEIANAATVSLIDTGTGQTVSTSVTDAAGSFSLSFSANFRPTAGAPYYLEAVKGLSSNQAGRPLMRIRTIVTFEGGGWKSLTNAVPGGGLSVTRRTTAVAIAAQYRALTPVQIASLMGKVTTEAPSGSFTDAGSLTSTEVDAILGLIATALANDWDPIQTVGFTGSAYALTTPRMALTGLSVSNAAVGSPVTLYGSGFSTTLANQQVTLNGAPATVTSVAADGRSLTFTVPPNATTGPLRVKLGSHEQVIPLFTVPDNLGFTIDNRHNPEPLSGYPARIPLDATHADFWARAGVDSSKIRVYDAAGTAISHWVESFNAAAKTAVLYARVATVPAQGQAEVFVRTDAGANASNFGTTMAKAGAFSGVVAAWRFDEGGGATTADHSGTGNTGTVNGTPGWSAEGGAPAFPTGSSMTFDGVGNHYVEVPSSNALKVDYLTIAAWINWGGGAGTYDRAMICNKENEYEFAVGDTGTPTMLNWALFRNGAWFWVDTGATIPVGTWTHVALTYDGRYARSYVNGVLAHTYDYTNGPTPLDKNDNALRIGARGAPGGASSFFKGSIDDLIIANRSFHADEIKALYRRQVPVPLAPRVTVR